MTDHSLASGPDVTPDTWVLLLRRRMLSLRLAVPLLPSGREQVVPQANDNDVEQG